jgi:acetylglutamate/LysW-gamma-L-alpha-aminoadipate kinase
MAEYCKRFSEGLEMIIVKIGGGSTINIAGAIEDLAGLDGQFVIVHGANALRDKLAEDLGQPRQVLTSVKGYTSVYSDEKLLDVMMMAYAGLRNKRIVEMCQQHGINAVGLTGLDGKIVQGKRNKGVRVYQDKKLKIVRDFSGKPQSVNAPLLQLLLGNGYVPVLTVPIIDELNTAINTENDDVVRVLQQALGADTVINLIEAPGFMKDPQDPSSLVSNIPARELEAREQQVEGRMKRKMLAFRKLFEHGASRVIIGDGRSEHPVNDALAGKGTVIE